MRRSFALPLCAMVLLAASAIAQEQKTTTTAGGIIGELKLADQHVYRLDFVIKELDDTKLINSRSYSMVLPSSGVTPGSGQRSSHGRIKAGYKVPIAAEKGPIYLDAGVEITASLLETQSGGLFIQNNTEVTSVADGTGITAAQAAPVLRSMSADALCEIIPGKALLLSSVDDPASRHRFQVEVTATKLK